MSGPDPIIVGGEPAEHQERPVAPWMLVASGVVAGVALAVLFGLTDSDTGGEELVQPVVTAAESVTTVSFPVATEVTERTEQASFASIPEGFVFSPLLVVTGGYPDTSVERWSEDGVEDVFRLPWATNSFSTDASGTLFAFSGQSATGRSLFVGLADRYVVMSATVSTWAWHATEPATLAWVDTSGGQRTLTVTRLELEPVGDRGEGLQTDQETTQLATARPEEWIMGFTSAGVALAVLNPGDGQPTTRVIDRDGQTVASDDTLRAMLDGFSDDGWAVVEESRDGPSDLYKVVSSDLDEEFDLGVYELTSGGVAWSPDGEAVALVDYRGESDIDFRLQVWDRAGERLLDVPLEHRVWDVAWLSDGHIVMVGTDGSGWTGLLFIEPETGNLTPVQAGEDPPVELAQA